ncbi:hypothetical protein VI817_001543 [Penicillium citrinum]|nr:hypothetical protein VI817_001543 [Penicillium citrinum]
MGASWSTVHPGKPSDLGVDLEQPPDPPSQSKYLRCYGNVVPSVCGDRLEDFYDALYDKIYFVQHKYQDSIVAFEDCEKEHPCVEPEEWFILSSRIPRVYKYLAHSSTNAPDIDIDRQIDLHPRIVK